MRPSPAWSAALLRPRASSPRWTPPPLRSSTSSSSSSSPTSSSYASGPPPWGSARGTAGARRPAWSAALLRPRAPSPRWTPPPPRSSTSSSSSSSSTSTSSSYASSSMHGARQEAWRGRGRPVWRRGGEAQLTSSNSSAWQHLGVGLVEVLRREQRLDVVVVVVVVVIPAIVVCVLERAGRGERARRVRAVVTSERDARA